MLNKIISYFIAHRLQKTDDVFEIAKIKLVFYFTIFMALLAIPFMIQLAVNGFWYHFAINVFEAISIVVIFVMFRSGVALQYIGIAFVLMDSVMSAGSLILQNGYFEIQAGLWSMLLIIYTFFVLGKKWGFAIVIFIALLYAGCIPGADTRSFLYFDIPANQILPTASAFVIFPFLLNTYIITIYINTSIRAENLMKVQKRKLEEQQIEIISSINYARRIQNSKLPPVDDVYKTLRNAFIYYSPKDIVSGDFYFFKKKENLIFLAAADCTGHGVPGAFMSMLCSEVLEDQVNKSNDLSLILKELNEKIKNSLRQSDSSDSTRDGMDIALCSMDTLTNSLTYAGANRPLWIIRKDGEELEEIKPTKAAIGGFTSNAQIFDQHKINLASGDTFYLFTDGYADQFGGNKEHGRGKKIMVKNFKKLLIEKHTQSMQQQEIALAEFFTQWMGDHEQVDDVLVIGVRV